MTTEREDLYSLSLSNFHRIIKSNNVNYIEDYSTICYASMILPHDSINRFKYEINKNRASIYSNAFRKYIRTDADKYEFLVKKQSRSDYSHLIMYAKDKVENMSDNNKIYTLYIYYKDPSEINDKIYDKLYSTVSTPLMKEWMSQLIPKLITDGALKIANNNSCAGDKICSARLSFHEKYLQDTIKGLFDSNSISIMKQDSPKNQASSTIDFVTGLDSYLNLYGDTLAEKIERSFTPKFNPLTDGYDLYTDYFEDSCFYAGKTLKKAQKDLIQSAVNNFKTSNVTFVVGEMGTGMCI